MQAPAICTCTLQTLNNEAYDIASQRFDGMQKYKMAQVIAATPILLHTALGCFCVGLVDFLWTLNRTVAIPVCHAFSPVTMGCSCWPTGYMSVWPDTVLLHR